MSARLILGLALLTSAAASAAAPADTAVASVAPADQSAWVATSNVDTTTVLEAQAKFRPRTRPTPG